MSVIVLIVAVVVIAGIVIAIFGWDRYRGPGRPVGSSAQPTAEVFVDPGTGQRMRVWYDPASGRREYRPD